MMTLATLNGEVLAVPGLRFRGARDVQRCGWDARMSLICEDARGAVELWEVRSADGINGAFGGVEVHHRTPQYDGDESMGACAVLHGAECWTDGSSLAYLDTFAPLLHAGDSAGVLRQLASWHAAHFGGAA